MTSRGSQEYACIGVGMLTPYKKTSETISYDLIYHNDKRKERESILRLLSNLKLKEMAKMRLLAVWKDQK